MLKNLRDTTLHAGICLNTKVKVSMTYKRSYEKNYIGQVSDLVWERPIFNNLTIYF